MMERYESLPYVGGFPTITLDGSTNGGGTIVDVYGTRKRRTSRNIWNFVTLALMRVTHSVAHWPNTWRTRHHRQVNKRTKGGGPA